MITKTLILINFRINQENKLEGCPKYYEHIEKTFANVLDAHASKKIKVLRRNHKPHVDKNLHRSVMKHSELKNKASK